MRWRIVGIVLAMLVNAGVAARAQESSDGPPPQRPRWDARPEDGRAGDRRQEDWRRGRFPGPPPARQDVEVAAREGFVFVDGAYLPAPYQLKQTSAGVRVNGQVTVKSRLNVRELAHQLERGNALIAFGADNATMLQELATMQLLRAIGQPSFDKRDVTGLLKDLPPDVAREPWKDWLASYAPPENLQATASAHVERIDRAIAEGRSVVAASQRLSTWAYPLTVFGMFAGVVSFGHLLQFPPRGNSELVPSRRRAELCRATVIFLGMVFVLSALDLTWTLLTAQAGQMHELNPIGQHLMGRPWLLATFKMGATALSCSLLFALRRHPRAQLASWWMCLVCTLLTFRWLVLHSMFVA
jgi:hypothetical protein